MGNYGKGLALAFFFIFFFSHAEECVAEEVSGTRLNAGEFPLIAQMNWRDEGFKRFMADVEANRRRVFNFTAKQHSQGISAIVDSFTVYQYVPVEGDTIFSLAARSNIPYSALASLNRMSHPTMLEIGKPFFLPTAPGLFVPQEPESALEQLMASSHAPSSGEPSAAFAIGTADEPDVVFYFFPGGDYNATQRAFFLNAGFTFPLHSFRITSNFGIRKNPVTGNVRMHEGLDLAAPEGTEVYATASGTVTEVGNDAIFGNYVVIRHQNDWASLYGHLKEVSTTLHATVKSGGLVGRVGTTGQSTGPHLHFELRHNGKAHDPDRYLFLPGRS